MSRSLLASSVPGAARLADRREAYDDCDYSEGADGWKLMTPQGFPNERVLQDLVTQAPDLLPLSGSPRVVVLDQAPPDLVRLVGYLEAVSMQELVIDLITVSSYDVGGQRIVVPQRVQPEPVVAGEFARAETGGSPRSQSAGFAYGVEAFRDRASSVTGEHREPLAKLVAWAERIEQGGLAEVGTYFGKRGELVLLPRLLPERVGLTSFYCWPDGRPAILLWRSVFERHAPQSIAAVAEAAGVDVGRGNMVGAVSDGLLVALFVAYQEAARK